MLEAALGSGTSCMRLAASCLMRQASLPAHSRSLPFRHRTVDKSAHFKWLLLGVT